MRARIFLIFFSFLTSLVLPLEAKELLLTNENVRVVMDQLFEYHIDKDDMSPVLMERALKIYLKQFDPSKSYLLQEEVVIYDNPNPALLKKMVADYNLDRYPNYTALNDKIKESILRARSWRQGWASNPRQLIDDASKVKRAKDADKTYAQTPQELQSRHYNRFIELLAVQVKELKPVTPTQEAKLITLCEKQLRGMENEYLGQDEQGRLLSKEIQEHQVLLRTLKALSQSLDAHTAYYSPEEAYLMKAQLEKGMCGIGVVLREGLDGIVIHELLAGGPAEQCGKLKKGDTIVAVDSIPVQEASFQKILEVMKGKEGSVLHLNVMRLEGPKPTFFKVDLKRSQITLAGDRVDVEVEPYGDGYIGKITLHSFYEGHDGISSEKDVKKAIDEIKAKGPLYGLVLDMRDNTGGFLSQSVKVTGLFISNGVVVISKYSDGSMKYYRSVAGKPYYDGPLAVLISKGSASATEIVAQALKDYGVAVVVGDNQTYGKGTIQHQTITSEGPPSFFKVTIGKYYSVSGQSTQIEGVKADIVVPTALNFAEIGESHLEYPVAQDKVAAAYEDSLADIDPSVRKWFQRYYVPALQKKETRWHAMIPQLKANSEKRLEQNKNFQTFLSQVKAEVKPIEIIPFGINDLQMEEAVNIVKDMILLDQNLSVEKTAS